MILSGMSRGASPSLQIGVAALFFSACAATQSNVSAPEAAALEPAAAAPSVGSVEQAVFELSQVLGGQDDARLAGLGPSDLGIWFWWEDGDLSTPALALGPSGCRTVQRAWTDCASFRERERLGAMRQVVADTLRASLAVHGENQQEPQLPEEAHATRSPFGSINRPARRFNSYVEMLSVEFGAGQPFDPARLMGLSPSEELRQGFDADASAEFLGTVGPWTVNVVLRQSGDGTEILHVLVFESEAG